MTDLLTHVDSQIPSALSPKTAERGIIYQHHKGIVGNTNLTTMIF